MTETQANPTAQADTGGDPLVTAVVCVYNGGHYFRPSIQSLLDQTYKNLEILIVDDGSTDGCVDTIRNIDDPRIRIISKPNGGKPSALNRALEELRGEFYVIQDADDLSRPDRVEKLVACMRDNPDAACVMSGHDLIINDKIVAPRTRGRTAEEAAACIERFAMPAHDPTSIFRVSKIKPYRYDPELRIAHGVDYILSIGEEHPILVVGDALYSYRIHLTSITKADPSRRIREIEEVLRRACSRRGRDSEPVLEEYRASVARMSTAQAADNNLAVEFIESVLDQRRAGHRLRALGTGLRCIALNPFDPHYHKAFLYAITPAAIARRWRRHGVSF